jgi:tRNA (uracil-5-)-methyltransferase TRM9
MFAKGELRGLVDEAAQGLGLHIGRRVESNRGVEIVQDGWERSNYYVELRLWNLETKVKLL